MSDLQIQSVLAQMRALAERAGSGAEPEAAASAEFAQVLQQSLHSVSELQQESAALATAFEQGDPEVSLARVVVAQQKAELAFEAVTQVRNRLLSAYQEIMSMQA